MKCYPEISQEVIEDFDVVVWDRLKNSSIIKAKWSCMDGFLNFSSKDLKIANPLLWKAAGLIINQSYLLRDLFYNIKLKSCTCFFEFQPPKKILLIDISSRNYLIPSGKFLKLFEKSRMEIPKILYIGKIDQDFIARVKNRTLSGMGSVGVLCKGKDFSHIGGKPILFEINIEK